MNLLKEYIEDIEKFKQQMYKKYLGNVSIEITWTGFDSFQMLSVKSSKGDRVEFSTAYEPKYYFVDIEEKTEEIHIEFESKTNSYVKKKGVVFKDNHGYFLKFGKYKTKYFKSIEEIMKTVEEVESFQYEYFDFVDHDEKEEFTYNIVKGEKN